MLSRRTLLAAAPGLMMAGMAHAQTPPAQTVPAEASDTILFLDAWTDTYGRPNANVMLNGEGPFAFMVDTGSTNSVIVQRVADRLGAPIVGIARVSGTTATADMPLAQLKRLDTGVVSKRDIRVAVLPAMGLAKVDGILGADVFIGKKLSFDILAREVKVEASRARIIPRSNMRLRNGMLAEVDGLVGEIRARLMLDTGAQHSIVNIPLKHELERRYPNLRRINRVRIMGVTGTAVLGDYFELPKVLFSKFTVSGADAVAVDAQIFQTWNLQKEPAMIVGASLLSRLSSFSIDYGALEFDGKLMAELIAGDGIGLS